MEQKERPNGLYWAVKKGKNTIAKWDGSAWSIVGSEGWFADSVFDKIGPAVSRNSDAVEFMQWVLDSNFVPTKGVSGWVFMDMLTGKKSDQYTTKQLYESFKASKP